MLDVRSSTHSVYPKSPRLNARSMQPTELSLRQSCTSSRGASDDQDKRYQELFASHTHADDQVAAVGADSDVAEIEERRLTTLLEIEERAVSYLRLRAGTAATEQALRLYRELHRSSMMARASDAFRIISVA